MQKSLKANYTGIICVNKSGGYGHEGRIPWKCTPDLKFFKEHTLYNNIIMGRKTFLSIKRILANRTYSVLSNSLSTAHHPDVVKIFREPKHLQRLSDKFSYVIGGDSIFHTLSDSIDSFYVTTVDCDVDCDVYFTYQNVLDTEFKLVDTFLLDPIHPLKPTVRYYERETV